MALKTFYSKLIQHFDKICLMLSLNCTLDFFFGITPSQWDSDFFDDLD